jgi:hypothetical protein
MESEGFWVQETFSWDEADDEVTTPQLLKDTL